MDIKTSLSGKIVRTQTGYNGFIPNPLSPKFEWDNALVTNLSRTDHILGMLSREGRKLPDPLLLIRSFIK